MKKSNSTRPTVDLPSVGRSTVQIYPQADGRTFIIATPVAKKKAKVKPKAKPKTVKADKPALAGAKSRAERAPQSAATRRKTALKTVALEPTSITGAKPGLTAFFNGFTLRSKNGKR